MRHYLARAVIVGAVAAVVAGCAVTPFIPGTREAPRTVAVRALDSLAFDPSRITVTAGETVRFVVTNEGQMVHEFAIGTRADLLSHAMAMSHHGSQADTSTAISLPPGATVELIHTFGSTTDVEFGCMVFDHYPAGMHGSFDVIGTGD